MEEVGESGSLKLSIPFLHLPGLRSRQTASRWVWAWNRSHGASLRTRGSLGESPKRVGEAYLMRDKAETALKAGSLSALIGGRDSGPSDVLHCGCEQLHPRGCGGEGEAGSRHRALLVQGPVVAGKIVDMTGDVTVLEAPLLRSLYISQLGTSKCWVENREGVFSGCSRVFSDPCRLGDLELPGAVTSAQK